MLNLIFFIASLAVFIIIPIIFLYSVFRPEKLYIHTEKNQNGKYSRTKFYVLTLFAWILFFLIRTWAGNANYYSEDFDTTQNNQSASIVPLVADDEELTLSLPEGEQEQIKEPVYQLSEYIDINEDPKLSFMEGIWYVQMGNVFTDEEKLERMTDDYTFEQDGFKKQDLAKSLLSEINAEIEKYSIKYKDGYRVKAPIVDDIDQYSEIMNIDQASYPIYFDSETFVIHKYDFDKKMFPLDMCFDAFKNDNFSMRMGNTYRMNFQSIMPDWYEGPPPKGVVYDSVDVGNGMTDYKNMECGLTVDDETQARKIEEVVVSGNIASKGYVYYDVPIRIGKSSPLFKPVLADITYFNRETGETLATKQFTW